MAGKVENREQGRRIKSRGGESLVTSDEACDEAGDEATVSGGKMSGVERSETAHQSLLNSVHGEFMY